MLLQLRGYLQKQSIYAGIDESQGATAVNNVSFDKLIESYGDDKPPYLVTTFGITYPFILVTMTLFIISLQLVLSYCVQTARNEEKRKPKLTREIKAAIISFTIISFVRLVLILTLDGLAIYFTENLTDREFSNIHYKCKDETCRAYNILYYTPHCLLIIDVIALVAHMIAATIATFSMYFSCKSHQQTKSIPFCCRFTCMSTDKNYYCLALTLLFFLISILGHLPYIAIAYLNDANYAGSVFIFYTIVTFLEFIILELTLISWFKLSADDKIKSASCSFVCFCQNFGFVCLIGWSLFFLYIIVAISVCFFYYLPINHSISSTSNQIIIVYQTGLIFVGAIFMYRTVFKRRNPIIRALDKCNDEVKKALVNSEPEKKIEWQTITDQEKIIIFYQYMIANCILSRKQKVPASASRNQPPGVSGQL